MILFLIKREDSTTDIQKDTINLEKALITSKKISKGSPAFIIIEGYDIYCIPGEVTKIETNGSDKIKLNLNNLLEVYDA